LGRGNCSSFLLLFYLPKLGEYIGRSSYGVYFPLNFVADLDPDFVSIGLLDCG
jgi:hypothetical protein